MSYYLFYDNVFLKFYLRRGAIYLVLLHDFFEPSPSHQKGPGLKSQCSFTSVQCVTVTFTLQIPFS